MEFPVARYISEDKDCPEGRRHLCIGFLPEKQARTDPATGKTKMVWAYGVAGFHYGATKQEAEAELRAWIESEREAELKRNIRVSRQQRELAKKRASTKRADEIALWGLEDKPAQSFRQSSGAESA